MVWSMLVTTTAYSNRRIPLFRTPARRPRKAYWLQVIGAMFSAGSMLLWINILGIIGVFVPFVVLLASLAVGLLHNRRVEHGREEAVVH